MPEARKLILREIYNISKYRRFIEREITKSKIS